MNKKNIFEPLTGVKSRSKHVSNTSHSKSERWIFGVLSADNEAPTVEDEKRPAKFGIFIVISLVTILAFFGRAFYLQIVEGNSNLQSAQNNRFRTQVIRAPRGLFYDRNKTPLVKNVANYEATIIPADLPSTSGERDVVYNNAAKVFGIKAADIKKIAESKEDRKYLSDKRKLMYTQPLLVVKDVTRDTSLVWESKKESVKGVTVSINPIREYLDNGLFSHAFGYVGRISEDELKDHNDYLLTDFIGKSGLEKSYETWLRGRPGRERVEVDSTGKIIKTYGREEPQLGDNLMLSVDVGLEKVMAAEMKKQLGRAKVQKATAIAINPQNGEVLAMLNMPTYDNNLFARGIKDKEYQKLLNDKNNPLLNRAISGEYPAGSTIKPYIASAALEEKIITEKTTFNSTGGIKIGQWEFPDYKKNGYGITNVIKAIAQSVNTFFYIVGGGYQNFKGLGPEKMKEYLEKFGFGSRVPIDIEGQSTGSIPDPAWKEEVKGEEWYLGDTYHMAIGQGDVLITPLQLLNGVMAIANRGTTYKIHFVKSVLDENGNVKKTIQPEISKSNIVSAATLDIVRRGMRETAISGGARSMKILPVQAAAKTGTAQFGPDNKYSHAWVEVFAPFDKPEIAVVVLVEGAGTGEAFAVPVAREGLKYWFTKAKR